MWNDATLAPARKIEGAKTLSASKTVPAAAPNEDEALLIKFDTSNVDLLTLRTSQIQALASCAGCLSAVMSMEGNFNGYELTDGALPLLGDVIGQLAGDVEAAGRALWEQYREARDFANGKVQS